MAYRRQSAIELFWKKFIRMPSGCWIWTGSIGRRDESHPKGPDGYGRFTVRQDGVSRSYLAHRFAYETLVGPIPEGFTIDHLCRVHACVNPAHLEPVTLSENIRRAIPYRKPTPVRTHCRYGHEFVEGSYTVRPDGVYRCTQCVRDQAAKRGEQRRLARIEKLGYDPGPYSRAHNAEYYRSLYTGQPRGTKFVDR